MVNRVEFGSGLGRLGGIVDRVVLDRYMRHLLRRRNAWLKAALEVARYAGRLRGRLHGPRGTEAGAGRDYAGGVLAR